MVGPLKYSEMIKPNMVFLLPDVDFHLIILWLHKLCNVNFIALVRKNSKEM